MINDHQIVLYNPDPKYKFSMKFENQFDNTFRCWIINARICFSISFDNAIGSNVLLIKWGITGAVRTRPGVLTDAIASVDIAFHFDWSDKRNTHVSTLHVG